MKKSLIVSISVFLVMLTMVLAVYALGHIWDVFTFVEDRVYHGFTYSGTLKNGRFHGDGVVIFQNGEKYDGGFANGRFDGEGTYWDADGRIVYTGIFKEGRIIDRGQD